VNQGQEAPGERELNCLQGEKNVRMSFFHDYEKIVGGRGGEHRELKLEGQLKPWLRGGAFLGRTQLIVCKKISSGGGMDGR